MKTKTKAPRVRWAKVANRLSRNPAWRVVVGRSVVSYEPCWELADSVARAINAELSRLVAARERRMRRAFENVVAAKDDRFGVVISAIGRALDALNGGDTKAARLALWSVGTGKLVKAEAKRRSKK